MEIAIIGGGIGGLTTALALERNGISSTVYERASSLNEVGAGIWLQPNALKVFDYLGLVDQIKRNGIQLDRVDITDSQLHPFKKNETIVQDQEGNKIISIHRAKLQEILYNALPLNTVSLGHEVQSLSQSATKVELNFDSKKVIADYVFGADGINSKIRKSIFPESELRHAGQTCWRGISAINLKDSFRGLGREAWGNKIRFGFSQVSKDFVYWFAVAKAKPYPQAEKSKEKLELQNLFKDFHPIVNQIIEQTLSDKIIRGDLKDLKRLNKWCDQNICLIGDAAHATTPNMGQGAGQAVEDAYVLAKLFAQKIPPKELFTKFEALRRNKVDYVVNNSWRFGQMAHSNLGNFLMKSVMKMTPDSVMNKQFDKLFQLPKI